MYLVVKPIDEPEKKKASPIPAKLDNQHCVFYGMNLKHESVIDLKTKLHEPYDPKYKNPFNVHIGQRKLMLSEIQMLNEYYKNGASKNPILLYVGAAPGHHLILLSIMYPNVFFMLYDGAKFFPLLKRYPNIYDIHEGENGFVTTDVIRKLKTKLQKTNRDLLFVSDIRLGNENRNKFEEAVTRDMALQEEWVDILKPKLSLLKFRMSYNLKHGNKIKYTKGKILYGIWPKSLSGETRLLVNESDVGQKILYDFQKYEEVMFFHNKYKRLYCFAFNNEDNAIQKIIKSKNNPYCQCYDCLAELKVLHNYSTIMKKDFNKTIQEFAKYMNKENVPTFQTNSSAPTRPPMSKLELKI